MSDENDIEETKGLSEVDIAIIDAFKTFLEVTLSLYPQSLKYLARSFAHQRDGKIATKQPDAAAVFEILRQFVAGPKREANREEIRKLLQEPPKGQA